METKEEILKQAFETCTIKEIIDYAKTVASDNDIITSYLDFSTKEQNDNSDKMEDLIRLVNTSHDKFCKDNKMKTFKDRLSSYEIMSIITDYYSESALLDYFDNDDLIDHLEGTYEMQKLEERIQNDCLSEAEETYNIDVKKYTVEGIQNMNPYDFRRYLCDLVDEPYYSTDESLFKKLKNNSKSYYPV
jgi:hypothetical protein